MTISDDGKRVAFLGGEKGFEVISLDDRDVGKADEKRSGTWPITLSGDGTAVAYRLSEKKDTRSWMVYQGVESGPYTQLGRPALSRDGRIIAFRASSDEHLEELFIRIGERNGPPFDNLTDPVLTPDGATVAYGAQRGKNWVLKVNDQETPLPARPAHVFIGSDGKNVGWVEMQPLPEGGSKMRVHALGKTGELFGLIGFPVFNPTEPLVAYGAEEDGAKFVVVGDRKVDTPDRISDPVFSSDGRSVGYGARKGRELWWRVLDVSAYR